MADIENFIGEEDVDMSVAGDTPAEDLRPVKRRYHEFGLLGFEDRTVLALEKALQPRMSEQLCVQDRVNTINAVTSDQLILESIFHRMG